MKNASPAPASKFRIASSHEISPGLTKFTLWLRGECDDLVTMIPVTASLALDERDLEERFIRASGPGGQNVNKVSTAVELRFRLGGYTELPDDVRDRLEKLAGRRLTLDGEIVIRADEHRTQDRNRAEAQARLVALVKQATIRPKPRHKTKIPKAQKLKRLEGKVHRGDVKAKRGRVRDDRD